MTDKINIPCNLCESDDFDLLFHAVDRLHGYPGTFEYVKCRKCGLVYMNPQIAADQIIKFYPSDYAPHQPKSRDRKEDIHKVRRKAKKSPILSAIHNKLSQGGRLLDVGCGSGAFLNNVRLVTGCEVCGVDFSDAAAGTAKQEYGIDVFVGSLPESPYPESHFDIITAWSSLEHVNNPAQVLAKVVDLLRPNGWCWCVIRTPNFRSFNARLFKAKWYHLDCPRHLYIYTPQTITRLMKKSGLLVRKVFHDRTSKGIVGSLQYVVYGDNYNTAHRNRLRKSSLLKALVSPLSRVAAWAKQSDTMVVWAQKCR
ncbi:MAG: class I SAM-dependent methyltransferase [Planctomycetota bacterium]|jgi:2-polyprenyl-3-methyl-5-hydroxy-6-metoxy-1,4-benzoquinol methylase